MQTLMRVKRLISGPKRKIILPTLLGLILTACFYAANVTKPYVIEHMGDLLFDSYQRAIPREYNPDIPVRIIDIDDESIKRIGQWPWPRTTLAQMQDRLTQAQAALIAHDIVYSEPDRTSPENVIPVLQNNPAATHAYDALIGLTPHDEIFADSLARVPTVGGFFLMPHETGLIPPQKNFSFAGDLPEAGLNSFRGAIVSMPTLRERFAGEGSLSLEAGKDGIIRAAPLIGRIEQSYYPSLSLESLRVIFGTAIKVKSSNASGELAGRDAQNIYVDSVQVGDFVIPTMPDGAMRVYFTDPQPSRYIPAWKLLDPNVPISEWQDEIAYHVVFIGTSALGLKDIKATPMRGGEPGVLVHAQTVEQILDEVYLERPYWAGMTELLILLGAGLLLSFLLPHLTAARGFIVSLILVLIIGIGSIWAFTEHLLLLNPIYPLLAVFTIYMSLTLAQFYLTEQERSRIRNAFGMYLSPTMVKKVSDDPGLLKLGGEERNMTVLFLDIRSFSKISEQLSPQEITTFLNTFLTPMTNILQDGKATIDKYIGDAIVAFWNAPLDDDAHEDNAAKTVLKMHEELARLNKKYADGGSRYWPGKVRIGIGLNTGLCCVGNLGSDQRFSYSMIGDAVNLAARIEGLTKQYGVGTLIGSASADALNGYAILEADRIRVVGRKTPEQIFILVGDEAAAKDADFKHLLVKHKQMLKAYRGQDWDEAKMLCKVLEPLAKKFAVDGYYAVMRERCISYALTPPSEDWDGVFVATSK